MPVVCTESGTVTDGFSRFRTGKGALHNLLQLHCLKCPTDGSSDPRAEFTRKGSGETPDIPNETSHCHPPPPPLPLTGGGTPVRIGERGAPRDGVQCMGVFN